MLTSIARMAAAATMAIGAGAALAEDMPHRGGTLTYAVSDDPSTLDCHAASNFAILQYIAPHYSTLLRFKPGAYPEIDGDVAESWTVDEDRLGWTFQIRPGIQFHDGSALDAADVAASYERLRSPPEGIVSARQSAFDSIAAVEVVDPLTVHFVLKRPDNSMLAVFASPWNCIYSAEKLAENPNYPAKEIMGSGPFRFVSMEAGASWTGERFDNYFREGLPYLDGFVAYKMEGPAVVNGIQSGQIMTEFRGVSPPARNRLVKALGDGVWAMESPALTQFILTFNNEQPPFDDARVRRALSLAIDRWGGAAAMGASTAMSFVGGVVLPGGAYSASEAEMEGWPGFSRDIEASRKQARQLLEEAGHAGMTLKLTVRNSPPTLNDLGVFLVDQWKQIGVAVEIQTVETPVWARALRSGEFEAILDIYSALMEEPTSQLIKYVSSDRSSLSAGRFTDRDLDAIWDEQRGLSDLAAQKAAIRRFEARLFEQSYSVPVFWLNRVVAANARLKGWTMSPSPFLYQDLSTIWLAE